jgi:hypothetical protein
MTTESHAAFREAYEYVCKYFEQVARLLSDASGAMERRGFLMLRPNGEALVGGQTPIVGNAETWVANWLFAFYAPVLAFGGRRYGVAASAVPRVPFVGFGVSGPEVELPAVYMGWAESLATPAGNVETWLSGYYAAVEPAKLDPTPEPVASVNGLMWKPSAHVSRPVRIALARIPMELITDHRVIDHLVEQLLAALAAEPG